MRCPGCSGQMEHLTVDAVLGTSVGVDSCQQCRAFWFEPFETEHLTPRSTLQLFSLVAAQQKTPAAPWPKTCYCPRCRAVLLLTHDWQRSTPFQYWRCDAGHGRFTAYIDFLREKNFIKPLSSQELADLRSKVQLIHCSNCGGPIDLMRQSVCPHCNAPISIVDMNKLSDVGKQVNAPAPPATSPVFIFTPSPHSTSLLDFDLGRIAEWFSDWLR